MSFHRPRHPRPHAGIPLSAIALSVALALGLPATDAQAQSTPLTLDLPAQTLNQALLQLGQQADIQIYYVPETVAGHQAPALQGRLSAEQALAQLLRGTGIAARWNGRTVSLSPSASGDATQLAPVLVQGATENTTEGSDSFTLTGPSSTATGLDLTLRETPQSISVITRQQIDEQHLTNLNDVVRATPGLNVIGNGVSADDTRYHARGFAVENMMIDGMPVRLDGFSMPAGDMIMYDRAEIVRGAPGLTVGTGNPSAVISLVRKRPTQDWRFNGTATVGSWQRYGVTADAGGPLNEAGTLRGRMAGSWQDEHSSVDVVHKRNRSIYGILEADIAERTTVALGGSYQRNHTQGVTWGLPAAADGSLIDYPRDTFYGSPWSWAKRTGSTVFADLTHELANGWQAKLAWMVSRSRGDYVAPHYWRGANFNQPFLVDRIFGSSNQQHESSGNLTLGGPWEAFGRTHELAFGLEWRRRSTKGSGSFNAMLEAPGWMSILDPDYIQNLPEPGPMTLDGRAEERTYERAAYAAGRFQLTERLSALVGARLTRYQYEAGSSGYRLNNEITPYAGLVFDLDDVHSIYASYTRILQPQSTLDADGQVLPAVKGTNVEVGLKGAYYGGALNTSLALFEIRQTNRPMADENGPSPCPSTGAQLCQRAAGEVKTQGVDAGVSGELLPGWQMSAGYTYVKSRYVKDSTASNIGMPFNSRVPRHQFKLFSSYRLPGELYRWSVGGSIYAQSSMYNGVSPRIEQGGYFTAGLMVGYAFSPQLSLRLNVENVFDRHYYESLGYVRSTYSSNNWYGAPRNAMLTLAYRM